MAHPSAVYLISSELEKVDITSALGLGFGVGGDRLKVDRNIASGSYNHGGCRLALLCCCLALASCGVTYFLRDRELIAIRI